MRIMLILAHSAQLGPTGTQLVGELIEHDKGLTYETYTVREADGKVHTVSIQHICQVHYLRNKL